MKMRCGNRAMVVHEVWTVKRGPGGELLRDENGRCIKDVPLSRSQTYHNSVKDIMIGYEVAYTAHKISGKPIDYIAVSYDSGATTEYAATAYEDTATGVGATWTAEWTNESTGDQTVNELNQVHKSGETTPIEFASDEGLAISVPRYAVLTITWTHNFTKDTYTQDATLEMIRDMFTGAQTTSEPWDRVQFKDTTGGNTYSHMVFLTISSGGSTSDYSVEFRATAENEDDTDHVVNQLKTLLDTAADVETYGAISTISPSVDWDKGVVNTCKITVTWAESGAVMEDVTATDTVQVTDSSGAVVTE